jgi:hypothetical protein
MFISAQSSIELTASSAMVLIPVNDVAQIIQSAFLARGRRHMTRYIRRGTNYLL